MQNEITPAGAQAPAESVGRHILTLVVHGAQSAVAGLLSAVMAAAKVGAVDVASAQTVSVPADHEAAALPIIQPSDATVAASAAAAAQPAPSTSLISDFLNAIEPQLIADANALGVAIVGMLRELVQPIEAELVAKLTGELHRIPVVEQLATGAGVNIDGAVAAGVGAAETAIEGAIGAGIAHLTHHQPPAVEVDPRTR